MIKTIKESDEVLYPKDDMVMVDAPSLDELKRLAKLNTRLRIRLCAHHSSQEDVHEMIIFHPKGTYVRPHKHLGKDESFHLIFGEIDCVIFDDHGSITKNFMMGDYSSKKTFYYRIPADTYHMQIFKKDTFFHEVTKGPFDRHDTINASWAPDEKDTTMVENYINDIIQTINSIKS